MLRDLLANLRRSPVSHDLPLLELLAMGFGMNTGYYMRIISEASLFLGHYRSANASQERVQDKKDRFVGGAVLKYSFNAVINFKAVALGSLDVIMVVDHSIADTYASLILTDTKSRVVSSSADVMQEVEADYNPILFQQLDPRA
ncbi:hypothetical protein WG66_003451 [Moniliophthora roreri]|nr:hypothetical protein WG66_003451 [Moniliophthora roreri]